MKATSTRAFCWVLLLCGGLLGADGSFAQTVPAPGVAYSIRSVATGKVVDVSGVSREDGAAVHQWAWLNGDNQKWRFRPLPPPDVGYYRIVSVNSGKVLDVSGAGQADGDPVIQWAWLNGDNQKWRVLNVGNGAVVLQVKHTGKVLDLAGGYMEDGTKIQQWSRHGGSNQRWILHAEGGVNPVFVPAPPPKFAGVTAGPGGAKSFTAAPAGMALLQARRVPRGEVMRSGVMVRQLGFAYQASNAEGQSLDLRPVLQPESRAMRPLASGGYHATLGVGLIDQNSTEQRPTPEGTAIQVFVDGAVANPAMLPFGKTNAGFQMVTLTADAPPDPVIVRLIPNFSNEGPTDTIPVVRPRIVVDSPKSLAGWGAGASTVTVGVSEDAGTREWSISLTGPGIAFSPNTIRVTRDQQSSVSIRSFGLGPTKIRASNPTLGSTEMSLNLEFPWAFMLASAVGGAIGSTLRLLLGSSRSNRVVRNHFLAGILMGLVVAGLFILGVNITTVPLATQDNPLAVALIAVVGSIGLVLLFGRLAGVKKYLED